MKLLHLRLHNFRQFYGTTPLIKFAAQPGKNVTLFLGDNGSGKTTLLNAFTWILYNTHTSGFLLPEEIVNRRAIEEAKGNRYIKAWAELEFEHKDILYTLKKTISIYKSDGMDMTNTPVATVSLRFRRPDGTTHTAEDVDDVIGKVLPKDLHSYFFFDGERIEKIVMQTKEEKDALAAATKKLLNLEVFSRAIKHLDHARKEFEKELKRIGDAETKELLGKKEEAEKNLYELENELQMYKENLDSFKRDKNEIENRLRQLDEVKDLQKRRDRLNEELENRKTEREDNHAVLRKMIAEKSYTVFIHRYIDKYNSIVEEMRTKKDLPSGIKQQFVNDLLNDKLCICGRCLDREKNAKSYEAVKEWLLKAGIAEVEEKIITLSAHAKQVPGIIKEFWKNVKNYQKNEEKLRVHMSKMEHELDEIHDKMLTCPREEVSRLQNRLSGVEENIENTNRTIWEIEYNSKQLNKEIEELEEEIQEHESKEEQQALVKKRLAAAVDAGKRLIKTYKLCDDKLRKKLQNKMNTIFQKISVTPYHVQLDKEYSIGLFDQTGTIARSQGESQLLSLSFIAGIIDLVREWNITNKENTDPETIEYPIIMDSPFGTLDQTNRPRVVQHINKIADQVVMMVSSTQWKGEVEQAALENIGKSYVLTYYTSKEDFKHNVSIPYKGKKYALVRKSPNDYEYTEIIEVDHG